jgi:hypothetical protein
MESEHWPAYWKPMTLNELRSALEAILKAEQAADVDWPRVQGLCRRTLGRLNRQSAPDYIDDFVYVFLADPELRQEDGEYAQVQRERLRNWLEGSEIISR